MSSPAEAHAEIQAQQREEHHNKLMRRILEGLQGMSQTSGFGDPDSRDYVEREVAKHLHHAYDLLHLDVRAHRK